MRILIAEDDFTSRTVLTGVLKKNGHEVVATVDGAEAWEALQQPDAPRLAILDWMMPEMDGAGGVPPGPRPGSRPAALHHHADRREAKRPTSSPGWKPGPTTTWPSPSTPASSAPGSRSAGAWSRCRRPCSARATRSTTEATARPR